MLLLLGMMISARTVHAMDEKDIVTKAEGLIDELEKMKAAVVSSENKPLLEQLEKELIEAAVSGNLRRVKALIHLGISPNVRDPYYGESPLSAATTHVHLETCKFLIEQKAMVNIPNKLRETPLHVAAASGNRGLCQLLLENKANINAQDSDRKTPLRYAKELNNKEVYAFLIERGAK